MPRIEEMLGIEEVSPTPPAPKPAVTEGKELPKPGQYIIIISEVKSVDTEPRRVHLGEGAIFNVEADLGKALIKVMPFLIAKDWPFPVNKETIEPDQQGDASVTR